MSIAEKRYFKLHTARHSTGEKSKQHALFDAIAAMPAYDAAKLRKQFAGAAFMRRLPIAKRRLYEAVLDSLDAMHANSSVDDRLRRMLHHAELLHKRALYADAAKVLRSAERLAHGHQRHALLLQIAEAKRQGLEQSHYAGCSSEALAKEQEQRADWCLAWQQADQLWTLKGEVFMLLYANGQALGPKEEEQAKTLSDHALLRAAAPLAGPKASFLHHHARSALAYMRKDLPACEVELESCYQVLRKDPDVFADDQAMLLGVMGNLAHVRMRQGKYHQALEGFRQFRKMPLLLPRSPSPDLEMKLFVMGTSLHLSVLAVQGEFKAAAELIPQLEAGLQRFGDLLGPIRHAELTLQASYAGLGAGKPDMALRWVNRMLGTTGVADHRELYALGRMLNLMCLVDLRKTDLLDYVVRNAQRVIARRGTPYSLELVLNKHAADLARCKTDAQHAVAAEALVSALGEALAASPRETTVLDHLDLISWAEAKAHGSDFAQAVRQKWNDLQTQAPHQRGRSNGRRAA